MGSVGDIANAVRGVLSQLEQTRAELLGVAEPLSAAGTVYANSGQGSSTAELDNAAAFLRQAYTVCGEALQAMDDAMVALNRYLVALDAAPSSAPAGNRPAPSGTPSGTRPPAEPWRPPPDRVEALRRELPPEITSAERGTGRKTHGRWIGADGAARTVVSGNDALARGAREWLMANGEPPLAVATHAEMKLAYYLRVAADRSGQPQHAVIVVNNQLCPGKHGCATLLPKMLPAGSTITVHAPGGYRRTFTGGA